MNYVRHPKITHYIQEIFLMILYPLTSVSQIIFCVSSSVVVHCVLRPISCFAVMSIILSAMTHCSTTFSKVMPSFSLSDDISDVGIVAKQIWKNCTQKSHNLLSSGRPLSWHNLWFAHRDKWIKSIHILKPYWHRTWLQRHLEMILRMN